MRCHLRCALWLGLLCVFSCVSSQAFASTPESPNLTELQDGWRMTSAKNVTADDSLVSQPSFDASQWYTAQHMPATVLQILQENGVYKNLYYGMNLATPGDLVEAGLVVSHDLHRTRRSRGLLAHLQGNQLPG